MQPRFVHRLVLRKCIGLYIVQLVFLDHMDSTLLKYRTHCTLQHLGNPRGAPVGAPVHGM